MKLQGFFLARPPLVFCWIKNQEKSDNIKCIVSNRSSEKCYSRHLKSLRLVPSALIFNVLVMHSEFCIHFKNRFLVQINQHTEWTSNQIHKIPPSFRNYILHSRSSIHSSVNWQQQRIPSQIYATVEFICQNFNVEISQ